MKNWQTSSQASLLHRKTVEALKEIYPHQIILQEYPIKIGFKTLYLDIVIPNFIAIECQGIQHEKFNEHFHESKLDLWKQKLNDEQKEIWCQENNLPLVKVWHHEESQISPEWLLEKIQKSLTKETWVGKI